MLQVNPEGILAIIFIFGGGTLFLLAISPVGKAYVADCTGDRLWRVDTVTDTLLGAMPLVGAPIALATPPV